MTITKIESITINRTDNGWTVEIRGENECENWVDELLSVVGDDSDPLLQLLSDYVTLPRRN